MDLFSSPILSLNTSSEEEEDLAALGSLSNIGQIEVKIGYAVIVKENQTPTPVQVPTEQKVNEKAKKGIDHQTRCVGSRLKSFMVLTSSRLLDLAKPVSNAIWALCIQNKSERMLFGSAFDIGP